MKTLIKCFLIACICGVAASCGNTVQKEAETIPFQDLMKLHRLTDTVEMAKILAADGYTNQGAVWYAANREAAKPIPAAFTNNNQLRPLVAGQTSFNYQNIAAKSYTFNIKYYQPYLKAAIDLGYTIDKQPASLHNIEIEPGKTYATNISLHNDKAPSAILQFISYNNMCEMVLYGNPAMQ